MPSIESSTRPKTQRRSVFRRLAIAITLTLALCLISTSMASAQEFNPKDYFQLNYDPVTFDKTEINVGESFQATITGIATCIQDLPMSASEATITSQVVAEHADSGTRVTLNPGYTITIKPFPSKKDETFKINQSIPLKFPAQAEPGEYKIIGKIAEAKIKVFVSVPITDYLPQEQSMGTVKYAISESTAAPVTPPTPENPPSPKPSPSPLPVIESTPSSPNIPAPQETKTPLPQEPSPLIPWWGELIVLVAIAAIVFNIIWFLRHRRQ